MSLKIVPFESIGTVTMAVSCIIFEIKRKYSSKIAIFIPAAFDAPVMGSPSEHCHNVSSGKTRMVWLPRCDDTFSRFDRVSACDREKDG